MSAKRNRPEIGSPEAIPKTFGGVENSLTGQGAFALVVLAGLANGGTRRRVMFSLPNAQRAVDRTHTRGLPASLHLVRLAPVDLDPAALDELGGEPR